MIQLSPVDAVWMSAWSETTCVSWQAKQVALIGFILTLSSAALLLVSVPVDVVVPSTFAGKGKPKTRGSESIWHA